MVRLSVFVAVVCAATACSRGANAELISREAVTGTFKEAGEPLTLELDVTRAAPGSSIDSYYVAANEYETTVGPFEIVVLESEDAAASHAVHLQARYGADLLVVRERNVVLLVVPKVGIARRMRLVEILESL